jgi:hypothetical protein
VQAFVLPERRRPQLLAVSGALEGLLAQGLVLQGAVLAAGSYEALERGLDGKELLKDEEATAVVPARSVGWVRLKWSGEQVGPQRLQAELWVDARGRGPGTTLELPLMFHEPVRTKGDLDIRVVDDDTLPQERSFAVWSSTRLHFRVKARVASTKRDPKADPFEVGKPVPLTRQELRALEKQNNVKHDPRTLGRVLSGYRIPVTLRPTSRDRRTPIDVGPFTRWVLVESEGLREPLQVRVHGRIHGLVEVGTDEQAGQVVFGSFPRSEGKLVEVSLRSQIPGLELAFDRARTPRYLEASLEPTEAGSGGRPSWKLKVKVLPGMADGQFPRREDPAYEDSAVYLQATFDREPGKPARPARSVRIAVSGSAE